MAPHRWSNATLREMVEHVAYEANMLYRAAQLIRSGRYPTSGGSEEQRVIGNALLESALVHLRSLDDFLSSEERGREDDVIALDYHPGWEPRRVLTRDERELVNKFMAHITAKRKAGTQQWQLDRMGDALILFREFLVALQSDWPLKAAWFKRWIEWGTGPGLTRKAP